MIKWTKTDDGCHIAEFNGRRSPKFGSRDGAATWLCETLERELRNYKEPPWVRTGFSSECRCAGWGAPGPGGCRDCGLRSMGG